MENINLNVNPYYDDFDETKGFHRVLFRPGFAVQARELTQMQTILQKQIERHGKHVFKEGSIVIPGSTGYTNEYYSVKLKSTFDSVDISTYISEYVGKRIVGRTSGVEAEVIQVENATTEDPITLFVKYIKSGNDFVQKEFTDGESLYSTEAIGSFNAEIDSLELLDTDATATGSSANIEQGVYFIRGHFVYVPTSRIILDKYTNTPSYRVGLTVVESLETPEEDSTLLDNSQGSTNYNAKGAHRLKMVAQLSKLALDSVDDGNFIELFRLKSGVIQSKARNTEYSVLGESLARRTYDESGDYTVNPFSLDVRDSLDDGLNNGIYSQGSTTDDGNTANESLLTAQISPGKAYVRGFEIENNYSEYIDIEKPRTYNSNLSSATSVEVGNYLIVKNVFNSPEITPEIEGEIVNPYRPIDFYDTPTNSRGSSSGSRIGFARVRAFEHYENNESVDILSSSSLLNTTFKLYVFDIRMFTKVVLSATPSVAYTSGDKVVGTESGAYGYICSESSGSNLFLTSIVGTFLANETLKFTSSTDSDELFKDSSNNSITVTEIKTFDFSSVKQVFMADSGIPTFTADVDLREEITLSGLVTYTTGTDIAGFQSDFENELRVGDLVSFPSGASGALEERLVVTITSSTTFTIDSALTNSITSVQVLRKRAGLSDQNKNILIRKLQKNTLKTLKTEAANGISASVVTIRKTFVGTTNNSGQVLFVAGTNEQFNAKSNTDYVLTVLSAGSGTAQAGDIVNIDSTTVSGDGTSNTLSITSLTLLGNGAKVRLIATIRKSQVNEKIKNNNRMSMTLVDNDGVGSGASYGTSAHHKEISLGIADAHKLYAIYESSSDADDPLLPEWTITNQTSTFLKGELFKGNTSGAIGRIINTISPITFVPINGISFVSGETIVGYESGESAVLGTFTEGSTNVTNNYLLDNGQRDNYYDISKIIRKSGATAAVGKLLIVYDYFDHGTGDFFTVDSYSSIDYKEIPIYTATRIDPEVREPTGEYDLRDSVDFRPRVSDKISSSVTLQSQTAYKVNTSTFNFEARNFYDTGASVNNIPKDNSNFQYNFENYIGRIDSLFLSSSGEFVLVQGAPAETPFPPKSIDDAMKIAEIKLPPYVISVDDVVYNIINNKRYSMKDIGRLDDRITNIEYYTSLNLLEKDAKSLEILDENGLNRFKSGILVDNFSGHSTGDVRHPDYRCSIDMENGELRPKYYMKGIGLLEENTTTSERTNDNYQKTGDLLTLPYTEIVAAEQPYATRIENLNPVLSFTWAGVCRLSPSGDEWFEVNRLPDLIINREGNFNTVAAQNRNSMGTIWNSWQTQWTGVQTDSTTFSRTTSSSSGVGGRIRTTTRAIIERTTTSRVTSSTRTGTTTVVVPVISSRNLGDRIVSTAVIPFIRSRNVTFTAEAMKPRTRVYAFFDKTDVSSYCYPTNGNLGDPLITSAIGNLSGVFSIPNPNNSNNPRFRTGERVFRLTSNSDNSEEKVETFSQATYTANGTLQNVQRTIVNTRNGVIQTRTVSQSRTRSRTINAQDRVVGSQTTTWYDPLAQSFMPQSEGGEYITKIDVYFFKKDPDIPVTCQIREMENGYPTLNVLPFGSKTLSPSSVRTSSNASVATTFEFDEPVFVNSEQEYCIVLFTDSQNYLVWISSMGETDVTQSRTVSEQPYLGVLFKSQNNTTWSAYDFEDLKFTMYRASFDTTKTATVTFTNEELLAKTLESNPLRTFVGEDKVKIKHFDHHMYSNSNNVIVSGVTSNTFSSLSADITSSDTSLTLLTTGGFPSSGSVYLKINNEILSGTISGATVSSLVRGVEGNAAAHSTGDTVELYQVAGIPLTEINKTHNSISNTEIDSYIITTTTPATDTLTFGGSNVQCSENAQADQIQLLLSTIEHPGTSLKAGLRIATGTSPSGTQTSFLTQSLANADTVSINENFVFNNPKLICSQINETLELSGNKSLNLQVTMTSEKENISPIIDLDKKSIIAISNRLNNISSSSQIYPTTDFVTEYEPDGDYNEAIYVTKKTQLKTPARGLKVYLSVVEYYLNDIVVMYKTLRSDDSSDFDEIGWSYFNNDGSPDEFTNVSTNDYDFIEKEFTANDLEEFIAFAIKIRIKGVNSSLVPRAKELRAIALST